MFYFWVWAKFGRATILSGTPPLLQIFDRIFLIRQKVHEWHLFSIRVEHFRLRNNELESLEFHQSVLLIHLLLLSNEIALFRCHYGFLSSSMWKRNLEYLPTSSRFFKKSIFHIFEVISSCYKCKTTFPSSTPIISSLEFMIFNADNNFFWWCRIYTRRTIWIMCFYVFFNLETHGHGGFKRYTDVHRWIFTWLWTATLVDSFVLVIFSCWTSYGVCFIWSYLNDLLVFGL